MANTKSIIVTEKTKRVKNVLGVITWRLQNKKNEMIRKDLLDEALRCAVTVGMRKTSVEQLTEAVGMRRVRSIKGIPHPKLLFFAVLENTHAETNARSGENKLTGQCKFTQRSERNARSFLPPANTFPIPKL